MFLEDYGLWRAKLRAPFRYVASGDVASSCDYRTCHKSDADERCSPNESGSVRRLDPPRCDQRERYDAGCLKRDACDESPPEC